MTPPERQSPDGTELSKKIFLVLFIFIALLFQKYREVDEVNPVYSKAVDRYLEFIDTYDNVVVYRSGADEYVVFPYMRAKALGQADTVIPLNDGNFLVRYQKPGYGISHRYDDRRKPSVFLYTKDFKYLGDITFEEPVTALNDESYLVSFRPTPFKIREKEITLLYSKDFKLIGEVEYLEPAPDAEF